MTAQDMALARLLASAYGLPEGVTLETVARRLARISPGRDEAVVRNDAEVLADAASRMTRRLLDEASELLQSGQDDAGRRRLAEASRYRDAAQRTYRRLQEAEQ